MYLYIYIHTYIYKYLCLYHLPTGYIRHDFPNFPTNPVTFTHHSRAVWVPKGIFWVAHGTRQTKPCHLFWSMGHLIFFVGHHGSFEKKWDEMGKSEAIIHATSAHPRQRKLQWTLQAPVMSF